MRKIIFKGIVGSKAFGTYIEGKSDIDIATIYKCDIDELLGLDYKEHDDINKDDRQYELGKFIKLLRDGNPNMIEILNLPKDCILETSEEWEELQKIKDKFITKKLINTFIGYANTQLNKSKGLNKKINWEKDKTIRKNVLDFCHVISTNNTTSSTLLDFLKENQYEQEWCGLSSIPHFKNCYYLFVDDLEWVKNYNREYHDISTHKYKGIVTDIENSNDVCLSSIPKYVIPKGILFFNKEAYSSHCKDYKEYQQWLNCRNEVRYNTNKNHKQDYDSKHIMHVVRLMLMAKDIVENNKIVVRRSPSEIDHLLNIKNGNVDLKEMIDWSAKLKIELEKNISIYKLPEEISTEECSKILIKLRKM